jgi:alpha-tubulin suppressor-like RCC1 family protein
LNITLSELYIDVIKCGKNHWLALTRSGEVCTWGG